MWDTINAWSRIREVQKTIIINKNENVIILGDSMIKNVKGWEIPKKLGNAKVYARHFSGVKRESPDHFVLYVWTNELDSERQLNLIAKLTMDVAAALKSEKHDLIISNITVRNDSFKTKANEGNKHLRKMFYERNFSLIHHAKISKQQHLNGSRIHLNRIVTPILQWWKLCLNH